MEHTKVFALDTNVLIQDPYAIEKLGNVDILLAQCVIEELDKLKHNPAVEMSARLASRQIAAYCDIGSLKDGVPTKSGGRIFVDSAKVDFAGHDLEVTNDNRIVLVALRWRNRTGYNVIVKSNDVNVRITANAQGIASEAFDYDRSLPPSTGLYSGIDTIVLTKESETDILRILGSNNYIDAAMVAEATDRQLRLYPNQCCYLQRPEGPASLAIYKHDSARFIPVRKPRSAKGSGEITPINAEQAFAYALLSDPSLSIVSLRGKAGSGKTLMALLAGYQQTRLGNESGKADERYDQILIYRPNIELGTPLGFLPGTMGEKFDPWKQPIVDNFNLIIRQSQKNGHVAEDRPRGGRRSEDIDPKVNEQTDITDFMRNDFIRIDPINYMRGRSLHQRYIVIDEAQNLTPHEIKTMLTRVGAGSKVVLTGDTDQIDNRFLTSVSNGLSYAIEKLKGQEVFGHITLQKTERSHLAELAANLL